jgi:hypothetical protein
MAGAGIFGLFLFLTCYLQNTKGLSQLETRLAFLPLSFSIAPTVGIVTTRRAAPHPRATARPRRHAPGRAGHGLLKRIGVDTAYRTDRVRRSSSVRSKRSRGLNPSATSMSLSATVRCSVCGTVVEDTSTSLG